MRHCFLAILAGSLLAASASSQQSTPVPDAAAKAAAQTSQSTAEKMVSAVKPRDYAQESFVIEKMYSRYRFEADGTGRKETVARIRVQSEAGVQQWGQLQEGYNSANERVEIVYVRVVKADGTIVKAGDDAVQDLSAP